MQLVSKLDEHEGLPGLNQSQTSQVITELWCYLVKNTIDASVPS